MRSESGGHKCHYTVLDCARDHFKQMQNKVSKGAKIRNRYNQEPHLTQDTNGKVTNLQLDTTDESQKVSLFPAGDHKAHINRRPQRHSKHKYKTRYKTSLYALRKFKKSTFFVTLCILQKQLLWQTAKTLMKKICMF